MFKLNAGAPEGSAIPNIWYLHFPTQSFSSIEERIFSLSNTSKSLIIFNNFQSYIRCFNIFGQHSLIF
jgi:hypothetical protein